MKVIAYRHCGCEGIGILTTDGGGIVPVQSLGFRSADMIGLIRESGGTLSPDLQVAADAATPIPMQACTLLAPIKHPAQDVVCLGVNFYEHREETVKSEVVYNPEKKATIFFSKRVTSAVDPGGEIDGHWDMVQGLDYEAELAVILGRDAKNVSREEAQSYIFGYTILNDISARNLQSMHQQWYFGKSLDDFTPMGPWIVTREEIPWIPALNIRSYLNGELRQNNNTANMIARIDDVLCQLTRGMTLKAGTILAMGTPSGVGMGFDPPRYMKQGDVIRCEIDGIGVLENTVR